MHFKEKLNELVVFRRGCSAANLWSLTLSRLSIIEGADILHKPHASDIGGARPLRPYEVGATRPVSQTSESYLLL